MHPILFINGAVPTEWGLVPLGDAKPPPGGRPPTVTTSAFTAPAVGGSCLSWGPGYKTVIFQGEEFCMHEKEINAGIDPCQLPQYVPKNGQTTRVACQGVDRVCIDSDDGSDVPVPYKGQVFCMSLKDVRAGLNPCQTNRHGGNVACMSTFERYAPKVAAVGAAALLIGLVVKLGSKKLCTR